MSADTALGLLVMASLLFLILGMVIALSRYAGWGRLADRYPARRAFPEPATRFGYATFHGWVGYNGCIVLAADAEGLHVRTWVLALLHAPIFIPWGQVQEIVPERRGSFRRYRIKTIGATDVRFALLAGTFAHAREAARRAGVRGEYD